MTQQEEQVQPGKLKKREYLYPGVDGLPEPLPPVQWTGRRWLLLAIALLCSAYFFWTVTGNSLSWITKFLSPHEGPVTIPWPTEPKNVMQSLLSSLSLVGSGVVVLLCVLGIGGKRAAGLDMEEWRLHRIGMGYYLRVVFPVSLLYWLLQRIPWRKGTTNLATTGVGTAIIIVAHWSYHAQYGIAVLHVVAAVYFSVICWRYAQSLWALVVGHMLWDVVIIIPNRVFAALAALLLAALGLTMDMYMQVMVAKPQKT